MARILHESYRNGMRAGDRHLLHSCTKSLCGMLVAIAEAEGRLSRDAMIAKYIPQLEGQPAWSGVSVQHVMDMQAGIAYSEDYADPQADYWRYARAVGYYPPGPGLASLMEEKLYRRVGAEASLSGLCQMVDQALVVMIDMDEYEALSRENCGALSAETLGKIRNYPIIYEQNIYDKVLGLATVAVINSGAWILVVAVLQAEIVFQLRGQLSRHLSVAFRLLRH